MLEMDRDEDILQRRSGPIMHVSEVESVNRVDLHEGLMSLMQIIGIVAV